MGVTYIRFASREEEAEGVEQLALHTRVNVYAGGVYAVPEHDLRWLDDARLPYRVATEDEIAAARGGASHLIPNLRSRP